MKNGNFVSAIECWLYKLALKLKIVRSSKNVGIKCQQWHKLHVCQLCRTLACLNRWLLSLLFPVWIDRDKVEDNLGPTWGSNSSCYIKISFQWHIAPYTHTVWADQRAEFKKNSGLHSSDQELDRSMETKNSVSYSMKSRHSCNLWYLTHWLPSLRSCDWIDVACILPVGVFGGQMSLHTWKWTIQSQ